MDGDGGGGDVMSGEMMKVTTGALGWITGRDGTDDDEEEGIPMSNAWE